jgi:putative toxin-antitoxin system antitoxin component (TIGR02293 family)
MSELNNSIFNQVLNSSLNTSQITERDRGDLPYSSFEILQQFYGFPKAKFLSLMGMTASTAKRRKARGYLSLSESELILRYAQLLDASLELMDGNSEQALQWLTKPARYLRGESPLEYAYTSNRADEVLQFINRVSHSVTL